MQLLRAPSRHAPNASCREEPYVIVQLLRAPLVIGLMQAAGETLAASGDLEHEALYLALAHAAVRPAHTPLVGAALRGAAARLGYGTLPAYMAGAALPLAWKWFAGGHSLERLAALRALAAPDQAAAAGGRGAYLAAAAAANVPAMLMDGRITELRDMAAALGVLRF